MLPSARRRRGCPRRARRGSSPRRRTTSRPGRRRPIPRSVRPAPPHPPSATGVSVRDSKTPAGPILTIDPAAFTTFVNWTSTTAE
ncbi:DUF397 domain-containing protein [Streptomyces canus]|uniref:DUF397 domain-containing protein n=1 Tax=Streptomyces canus TaxID=58343 RepID=UPI002E281D29|nr:DUF397 domain-containing protein [Streptomyces canus]